MRFGIPYVVAALGGLIAGAILTSTFTGPSNYAQITIINETGEELTRVEVVEARFGNRYIATSIQPRGSVEFPVFAWGELGYRLDIERKSGARHSGDFYAESGYEVTHTALPDDLSYDVSRY